MSDDVWERDEIQSPCVKICVVHPAARLCTGCYRSLDEIRDWSRYSDDTRLEIINALPERAASLVKRRGGRAARLKR